MRRRKIFFFFPLLNLFLFLPFSINSIIFNSEEETAGIRCFCDKQTCGGGALVCAGKYCLIGLRNDDVSGGNKLEQHCVDEQIYSNKKVGCEKEWQKWAEVCICDESLCNTFAFLRSQIDGNSEEQQQQRLIASDYADSSALTRWKETAAILRRDSNNNNIRIGENILDSNEENEPSSRRRWMERQQNKQGGGRGRGANLVLLLVVLPLVVGAFTVKFFRIFLKNFFEIFGRGAQKGARP